MDMTTTCPTCGHVESVSSATCTFCGVELTLESEPVKVADAYPAHADPENVSDGRAEDARGDNVIAKAALQKPESVDDAVAHVLSADGDEEPLELVDAIDTDSAAEPLTSPQKAVPTATGAPPSPEPQAPTAEKVVLPEPVQLKADTHGKSGDETAAADGAPAPPPAGSAEKEARPLKQQRAALARAEALKQKKLAVARAVALKKKKAAMTQLPPAPANFQTRKLLKKYLGKTVGINYDNSAKIAPAELVALNSEYLTVAVSSKGLHYHFPLPTILSVIEGADGKGVPTGAANEVYDAVVKIYPLVLF